jgi:hypothetical protein
VIPKVRPHRRVDKSALAIPVAKRVRCAAHLDWLREQRCCVPSCQAWHVEVHHLLAGGEPKARSMRASDSLTVPLCPEHHRGQNSPHHDGDEQAWAAKHGLDLPALAQTYWEMSAMERSGSML